MAKRKSDFDAMAADWARPADDAPDQAVEGLAAEAVELPTSAPTPDKAIADKPKRKATGKAPAPVAVGDAESGRLVQVAAYVTPAEAEAFAALAKAEDRPVSYVLRRLIRQALGVV